MSINNLNPEQRAAVRRVRLALKLVPEPERRVITAALTELWQMTIPLFEDIQQRQVAIAPLLAKIERLTAKEDALVLALEERLGHEPGEGEKITYQDELRAEQIFLECQLCSKTASLDPDNCVNVGKTRRRNSG